MIETRIAGGLFAGLSLLAGLAAQAPTLLVDVETAVATRGSVPRTGALLPNGDCVFAATDAALGRELWLLPAGASTPVLLLDLHAGSRGSHPRDFVLFQGEVWFSASDGQNGRELWRTDGTAAGTVLAVDIAAGAAGSAPTGLIVCGGRLIFTAFAAGAGREPHASDGTAAGTILLADLRPGVRGSTPDDAAAHAFVCCNGEVVFGADDGATGVEPHASDGTPNGTRRIVDLQPGAGSGFDASERAVCCNGEVFFRGDDGGGTGKELYATDGTAGNTRRVADVHPSGSGLPRDLCCHAGQVFFSANEPNAGRELYRADGSATGAVLVRDIRPGPASSNPAGLASCNGMLWFAASDVNAFVEPHVSDGTTAGTVLLADVDSGVASSLPRDFVACGTSVLFAARTANTGEELFVSDGTAAGTVLVDDLAPGSASSRPTRPLCRTATDDVVFAAEGAAGDELYVSDGTAGGTTVHDLDPAVGTGDSDPHDFRALDASRFYFVATTAATGEELWFHDGQNTTPIEVVVGPDDSDPRELTVVGRTIYFTASQPGIGRELFRSVDGGPAQLVADIRPGFSSSNPGELVAFDQRTVVMEARTGAQGFEIVTATNGVPGVQVHDVRPGTASSFPSGLSKLIDPNTGANYVVFAADDGSVGSELFAYDGVSVALAADLEPGPNGSSPAKPAPAPDNTSVVFSAVVGGDERVFSVTVDELNDLTFSVEELANLAQSFFVAFLLNPSGFVRELQALVFVMALEEFQQQFGEELYTVDSNGQPSLFADLNEGAPDSGLEANRVTYIEDVWVVGATDEQSGNELHLIGASGVVEIDVLEGPESSAPSEMVQLGDGTLFEASGSVEDERVVYLLDELGGIDVAFDGDIDAPAQLGNGLVFGMAGPQGNEVYTYVPPGAQVQHVGTPCDGRKRVFATAARVGKQARWRAIGGGPADVGFLAFGVPLPQPLPLFECELHIDPATAVIAASGAGSDFEVGLSIALNPNLVGLEYALQAVWFEALGSIGFSDAVYGRIGQ